MRLPITKKAFDLHFILVMSGQKIILMKIENLKFIDSNFFALPATQVSAAFGLTAAKGWYPHNFNTKENLDYVVSIPDTPFYGIDEMSVGERAEFLDWYDSQRSVL